MNNRKLLIIACTTLALVSTLVIFLGYETYQIYTEEEVAAEQSNDSDTIVFECNPNVTAEFSNEVFYDTSTKADAVALPNTRFHVLEIGTTFDSDFDPEGGDPWLKDDYYHISLSCSPLPDGYNYDKFDIYRSSEKGALKKPPQENLDLLSTMFPHEKYEVLYHPDKITTWFMRDKEGYVVSFEILNIAHTLQHTEFEITRN